MLTTQHHHGGFNLIEVMVALAVLSIGLLGIAALQIQGVRFNYGSFSRSQAIMIASDFAERMYANRPAMLNGNYSGFDSNAVNCSNAPSPICGPQSNVSTPAVCSTAQMATYDRFVASCGYPITGGRYGGVRDLLTAGRLRVNCVDAADADVACTTSRIHRILVNWEERGTDGAGENDIQQAEFRMVVQP